MTNCYPVPENRPWFHGGNWPKRVPTQLDIDFTMSLADLWDRAVKNWGDSPLIAFVARGLSWFTYKDVADLVDRLATYLHQIGVNKGDVVGLLLPNCTQYVVAYYAVTKIGAVVSGINQAYTSTEVLHQCKTINAKYLITLDTLYNKIVKPFIDDGSWSFGKIIYTNIIDNAMGISSVSKAFGKVIGKVPKAKVDHSRAVKWLDALTTGSNPPVVTIDPVKDVAVLVMTDGVTGDPKAVMLTHENCVSNARQCEMWVVNQKMYPGDPNIGQKTGMIGVLPLFHPFAMTAVMNLSVALGSWMLLFPHVPLVEDILGFVSTIILPDGSKPNGFCYCGSGILFKRIVDIPQEVVDKYNFKGRLKLCICEAGPSYEHLWEPFVRKTGSAIAGVYGLTEASPVVIIDNFFGERDPGYIGVPVPGTDVMIFDPVDFSKGPIEIPGKAGTGEICVCGPQVMKGYLNVQGDNIKEWDGKSWLLTGDFGFMDELGRFSIKVRNTPNNLDGNGVIVPDAVQMLEKYLLEKYPVLSEVAGVEKTKDKAEYQRNRIVVYVFFLLFFFHISINSFVLLCFSGTIDCSILDGASLTSMYLIGSLLSAVLLLMFFQSVYKLLGEVFRCKNEDENLVVIIIVFLALLGVILLFLVMYSLAV